MAMPDWWNERRFGVFVHASPACVPGWAPIGAEAADYRRLVGDASVTSSEQGPFVEALAHHRDRWGHVETFDDFIPLLTYESFDAEAWARLVSESGANYSILTVKHDDGWTWWDAPLSTRPLTEDGPHRNVLGEYAAACERHGIELGTSYSFADADVDVATTQVLDLVERHGSVMLCTNGDGRASSADAVSLLERVRLIDRDVVVDDGWPESDSRTDAGPPRVPTFHGEPPDDIVDGPWQLVRGLGPSLGYNRAERDEHRLTAVELVDVYTEVAAKGGNLLLSVAPDADGVVPPAHADVLRRAGAWISRFATVVARSRPWTTWGDATVRYVLDGDDVLAIDVGGNGTLAALCNTAWKVNAVAELGNAETATSWRQDADGVHIDRTRRDIGGLDVDIAVYRVSLMEAERPDELFASTTPVPIPLGPLLADARPGAIVQLGDGIYEGPVSIPPGVTVRGLGPTRTTVGVGDRSGSAATAEADTTHPTITVGANARLEHVSVAGSSRSAEATDSPVVVVGGDSGTLLGCTVAGAITVTADDVLLRAVSASRLVGVDSDRLHVSRCEFRGRRDEVGIDLRHGGGHVIDSNQLSGHLCSVRLSDTTGSNVHGNTLSGRWWGIHLDHCESAHVHGNRIRRTMRAVDVDGGTQAVVDGNAVTDGDSGCIVEDGASDCEVYGNFWDRCRIGLLAWDAVALHHQDNIASGLHEPDGALVIGP